jgi:predicted MFS family arabinose efflux permease
MMMALGPALIKSIFPRDQLGRSLGQIGIATSLGLMSGPVISGLLIHWSHWRIIFLITVPVGLLVFVVGRMTMSPVQAKDRNTDPFDRTGALLWIFAVTMTMVMTTHAATLCCTSSGGTLFISGCSVTLAAWYMLIRHEQGHPFPLLPLELFKERFFSMAMLSAMLSFCVLFSVLLLTPFYLRSILRLSADKIGYVMMALPLCVFFVSPVAGALHDRIGAQIVATTGLLICLTGLLLFTTLGAAASPVYVAFLLATLGFGQAMFLSPNSAAAMAGVSHQQSGVTSSLLATARNMGMLIGTALAGLIFSIYFSRLTGGMDMKDFKPVYTQEFLIALKRSFQAAALLAAVGVAASWRRGKQL